MQRGDIFVVFIVLAITAARYVLIGQPWDLATEEAQYWLWSQTPAAGYFTKPPMIAWIIAMTTGIFGDTVFGVKASAPLIQMVSALLMGHIARHTAPKETALRAGQLAAIIWITLPAGNIAGFIISTDSPMIMFVLAMLAAIAPLARGIAISGTMALVAGIFFGLAMMSKYAAFYILIGLALWWLTDDGVRRMVGRRNIAAFAAGALAAMAPNIIWNLLNGFATVTHLGHNANLEGGSLSVFRVAWFWASQMAIAGPVLFGAATVAVIRTISRNEGGGSGGKLWLWLAAPAFTIITVQALLSDANANWAAVSWPPLLILTAIWLAGARRLIARAAIIFNLAIMGLASVYGLALVSTVWQTHTPRLTAFMEEHDASSVITTRRGHAAPLIWEMRKSGIEVTLIDRDGIPANHYEVAHPWRPQAGRRAVLVGNNLAAEDFGRVTFTGIFDNSDAGSGHRNRLIDFHLVIER